VGLLHAWRYIVLQLADYPAGDLGDHLSVAVGLLVGPTLLNVFHFNPLKESALLEVLTEVAVLISLFAAGVKMPAPMQLARWRTPLLLASHR
jgi:NhaP-type Na+/H+ or K+/H+ antiporter